MGKFPKEVKTTKLHEKAQDPHLLSCLSLAKKRKWKYQLLFYLTQHAGSNTWEEGRCILKRNFNKSRTTLCLTPVQNATDLTENLTNMMDSSELLSKHFLSFPQMIKSHKMDRRMVLTTAHQQLKVEERGGMLLLAN